MAEKAKRTLKEMLGETVAKSVIPHTGILDNVDPVEEVDMPEDEPRGRTPFIRDLSVEFVGHGSDGTAALMRGTFGNVTPAGVIEFIRGFDADAKFRDDFPSKGFNRETKLATVYVVEGGGRNGVPQFRLTGKGPDGNVSVRVIRDEGKFIESLRGLGKLAESELEALAKAVGENKNYQILIEKKEERFGVKYWHKEDPASGFVDSVQAEGMVESVAKTA